MPGGNMSVGRTSITRRTIRRALVSTASIAAMLGASLVSTARPALATTPTLYAVGYVTGGAYGGTDSNLYTVDVSTGVASLVGPIEVEGTQLQGITGIDVGLDGALYAVDNAGQRLLTIDPTSGAATVVGSYGSMHWQISDISFDSYGYLYGMSPQKGSTYTPSLVRIDPDGAVRAINGLADNWGGGVAVDSSNAMYVKTYSDIYRTDPQTGEQSTGVALSSETNNPADFSPSDVLYTVLRPSAMGYEGTGSTLETIDPSTGDVTAIGNDPDVMITGIAFDTGTASPAGTAADIAFGLWAYYSPISYGDDETFGIDVVNRGPATATVTVNFLLSSSWEYVNDDAGGNYDPTTGEWTVGSLASGESAGLLVVATARSHGTLVNYATLSSDVYTPGPTVAALTVTVPAQVPGAPTIDSVTAGDHRARVSFTGPTDNGGAAVSSYRVFVCAPAPGCTPSTLSYTASGTTSPVTVPGLTNGISYNFVVAAVNSVGQGAISTAGSATPQAPTITVDSATSAKGKITVTFQQPTVAPLEQALSSALSYQVGSDRGKWVACTPTGSGWPRTCTVKLATKSATMRVSDDGGDTWGPASSSVTVTKP